MEIATVVVVAGEHGLVDELRPRYRVVAVDDVAAAARLLRPGDRAVVVLGAAAIDGADRLPAELPQIWIASPTTSCGRAFYVCPPTVGPAARASLIAAAWAHCNGGVTVDPAPPPPRAPDDAEAAATVHRVVTAARELAACEGLRDAATRLAHAAIELGGADAAQCWFVDGEAGALWRHDDAHEVEASADTGLVGYVARTAATTVLDLAAGDARFVAACDDPDGDGRGRWLAVALRGHGGHIHAVLVVHRSARRPSFVTPTILALEQLAAICGPGLDVLAVALETRSVLATRASASPFAAEAVREHAGPRRNGAVLRVAPGWVRVAYWSVVAIVVLAVGFVAVARVHRYSTGPAIIRVVDRTEVTAIAAGTIATLEVGIGDRVRRGDPIARLHDPGDDVERRQRQFDAALRSRLLAADDPRDDAALGGLRSELEAAAARHEASIVRAPDDGVIGDLRIRVGQAVAPGDVLAAIVRDPSTHEVVAVLPGVDRPQLRPGLPMRLAIVGSPHAHLDVVLASVGREVVGPAELARLLGPVAEPLAHEGPAVVVRAPLDTASFMVDGRERPLVEGLPAVARVRLARERVLDLLVPGLAAEDEP